MASPSARCCAPGLASLAAVVTAGVSRRTVRSVEGNDHRADPRRDEERPADLPCRSSSSTSGASRPTTRTARRINAIVVVNPRRARRGRRARPPVQGGRTRRAAALRPRDRQGQLRDDRTAERRRVAVAQGIRLEQGRVPGQAHQGGRRDRARQVEHGGVRVHAVRDRELDPAGLHEESLRARSRDGRIERRHGGGGRRQLRRRRPRQRHRQLDPRAVVAPGAGRHPIDDGADEPRGVAPLNLLADIAGPMARTVEDAVAVFQVVAGRTPTIR